jgi:hypothetical protein
MTSLTSPALSLNGDDVSRRLLGLPVPGDNANLLGVSAALRIQALTDPPHRVWSIYVDPLKFRYAWSGGSAPLIAQAGGVPMTVTRGPLQLIEFGGVALNLGAAVWAGPFNFRAGLDWGGAYLWSQAMVQPSSGPVLGGSVKGMASVYARTPFAACLNRPLQRRKSDEEDKGSPDGAGMGICVTLTPTIYEFGWFSAWSAGIEVDL